MAKRKRKLDPNTFSEMINSDDCHFEGIDKVEEPVSSEEVRSKPFRFKNLPPPTKLDLPNRVIY